MSRFLGAYSALEPFLDNCSRLQPYDYAKASKAFSPYKAPKPTLYPEHTNASMIPAKDRPKNY